MTTTQAVGVALILLGVAYGIVWVGWLRCRPTDPVTPHAASEESVAPAAEIPDVATPAPVASEESAPAATEIPDATKEEAVDVTQGVPGRYLGTTSPDADVAKDLTRAGEATLTIAYGALAWRPAKGTALRAEARDLVAVDGLDVGRAGADTPLTVRWHPPAAPGATYETRFVPATPADRAALADALRALRADLTTTAHLCAPVPEETA